MCSITVNCTYEATYDGTLSSCVDMYVHFLILRGGGEGGFRLESPHGGEGGGWVRGLECSEFRILLVSFANQQEELPLIDLGSGVCQALSWIFRSAYRWGFLCRDSVMRFFMDNFPLSP
jgi:hypothetical protein